MAKEVASVKEAIRQRLRPGKQAPWEDVVRALNRTVGDGWRISPTGRWTKARHDLQRHLYHSVRRFCAVGTGSPGLASGGFPCPARLGNWVCSRPSRSRKSALRMP